MASTAKKLTSSVFAALLGVMVFGQSSAIANAPKSVDGTAHIQVESEFKCKELKKYEPLPDMPQYTGQAEFLHGIITPEARGGAAVTYEIAVRENREMVVYWFREALKSYKWTSCGDQAANSITANKAKSYVQIVVSNSGRAAYPTAIMISYRASR